MAKHDDDSIQVADRQDGAPSRTRRRLVKTGIAAIPVIVTLKALPVRAYGGGMDSLGDYDYNGGEDFEDENEGFDDHDELDHDDSNRRMNSR